MCFIQPTPGRTGGTPLAQREPLLTSAEIGVTAKDGDVRSWFEKEKASQIAWKTKRVWMVNNNLSIADT